MELFSIVCPTCSARLKVRDAAAIGQILNCPKCSSMVRVAAPPGWQPPAADTPQSSNAPSNPPTGSARRRWENQVQPGEKVTEGAVVASGSSGALKFGDASTSLADHSSGSNSSVSVVAAPSNAAGSEDSSGIDLSVVADRPIAPLIKWGLLIGMPAIALVAVLGTWLLRRTPQGVEPSADVATSEPAPETEIRPEPPAPPPNQQSKEVPVLLARRWLPSGAVAIVSLRPNVLFAEPAARLVIDRTAALWQGAIEKLAASLGLEPPTIDRVTWSATDAGVFAQSDWLAQGAVAIDLEKPLDADSPAFRGSEPLEWKVGETPTRRLKSQAWPNPFVVIDKRTLVTAPEAMLRALAAREGDPLANAALAQLIAAADARSAALALVDLRALRDADALPQWLPMVDLWQAEADDWQLLRTVPLALSVTLALDKQADAQLELACDGGSSAEEVKAALDCVLKAMEATIAGGAEALSQKLLAGEINTATAGDLNKFLAASQSALAGRGSGLREDIVWTHLAWQGDLPRLASGLLAGVPQLEAGRLAAVRVLDEEHHRALLAGLAGYVKAEGAWPAGAAGATLLPPETRLSWQATLLPYYGHLDWHGELNFARAWNDAANLRVTRRPLDLMINPAFGPSKSAAGFPVTHYVGVAGLGPDAGQLEASDPRAGVFGFRSRPKPADIPDGASNTMAVAGVGGDLGPWAAGGTATVRGLAKRPYINGPDGFSSGQPGGLFVGMADGSVRFLSKDIDPAVLERLATINGGNSSDDLAATSPPPGSEGMPPREPPKARAKKPSGRPPQLPPEADKNVLARLNDTISDIELKTNLTDLLLLLSQMSTVPMTVDAESLAQAGVDPAAKVSLKLANATIAEILDEALRPYELKYVVVGKQVIVVDARQAGDKLETVRLKVRDLAAGGKQDASELARLVETFVAPTAWQAAGGAGSIEAADGELVVKQTPKVAHQVADFLDKLRLARQLPVARRQGPPASLATRWSMARDKLAGSITVNFAEPTPLAQIVAQLQKASGIKIVFDGLGLAEAGVSPQDEASLSTDQEPLADVLDRLLEPLKLAYWIVNADLLAITSQREVAEELEVEIYPVESLLKGEATDDFIASISKEVAAETWPDMGGPGALTVDALSSHLIVLAPQAVQIELEKWLTERAK